MINMKIKCTVCGLEETLDNETLKELSNLVNKYKMSADSYTYLMNKMRGKCLDSDEHSFIFDEEFMKQIQEIINKDKSNMEEVKKLENEGDSILKECRDHEEKIKELKTKVSIVKDRLTNLHESGRQIENEIEKMTGNNNIEMWK